MSDAQKEGKPEKKSEDKTPDELLQDLADLKDRKWLEVSSENKYSLYCLLSKRFDARKDYDSKKTDDLYKPPRRHFVSTLENICNLKSSKEHEPQIDAKLSIDLLYDTEAKDDSLARLSELMRLQVMGSQIDMSSDPDFERHFGFSFQKIPVAPMLAQDCFSVSAKKCRRVGH